MKIKGNKCSTNFVFDECVTTIEQLIKLLQTEKSLYFIHKVFPSAFIFHQPLATLCTHIKCGNIWTIKRIDKKRETILFPKVDKDCIIMGRNLNLKDLENKLNKILYTETEESLKEWLNKKRKL